MALHDHKNGHSVNQSEQTVNWSQGIVNWSQQRSFHSVTFILNQLGYLKGQLCSSFPTALYYFYNYVSTFSFFQVPVPTTPACLKFLLCVGTLSESPNFLDRFFFAKTEKSGFFAWNFLYWQLLLVWYIVLVFIVFYGIGAVSVWFLCGIGVVLGDFCVVLVWYWCGIGVVLVCLLI